MAATPDPARTEDLGSAAVTSLAVGPMDNNAYLVTDSATGRGLLVDAAAEPDALLRLVGDTPLDAVVTTHRHRDHWGALARVVAVTGATTVAGEPDVAGIPVPTDRAVEDGETVTVGMTTLRVLRLTGHTPGGIALALTAGGRTVLLTGDSLFPGGVGRTASPADFTRLLDDVTARLFDRYGDDTVVLPGHGAPTTLGAERPHLPEWRARGW